MQMFERHHAAAAAALVALGDLTEMTDAAEPRAVENDELHAREMEAKAGVNARPERGMAIELPFDRHGFGIFGEGFVPADQWQRRKLTPLARRALGGWFRIFR